MSSKVIISLITALMLASSGIAGTGSMPAAEKALDTTSLYELAVSEYYAVMAAASVTDQAAVLADEPVLAETASDIRKAADTAAALSGISPVQGAAEEDDESHWYCPDIPMKKEHQKLLWDCCNERGLDYIDMLALISLESNFQEKCSNGKYKGYFQISSDYGPSLSRQRITKIDPLDGSVYIVWGTAFFSWILVDKRVQDLEGQEKRDVTLSIYQRGAGGYDRYGLNQKYLDKYYKKRDMILALFEK